MNFLKRTFLLLAFVALPAQAMCPSGLDFMCSFLKDFQKEITPNLPMQLSDNLYLRQVVAIDNTLHMYVLLSYDRTFLINEYSTYGLGIEDAKAALKQFAINYNCSNNLTSKMIKAGGVITSHYQFNNGEELVTFSVSSCN